MKRKAACGGRLQKEALGFLRFLGIQPGVQEARGQGGHRKEKWHRVRGGEAGRRGPRPALPSLGSLLSWEAWAAISKFLQFRRASSRLPRTLLDHSFLPKSLGLGLGFGFWCWGWKQGARMPGNRSAPDLHPGPSFQDLYWIVLNVFNFSPVWSYKPVSPDSQEAEAGDSQV